MKEYTDMRTPLLILVLLVTCCGTHDRAETADTPQEIYETVIEDSRLRGLYEEFLKEAEAQGAPAGKVPHSILWTSELTDGRVGGCRQDLGTIRVSDRMASYDDYQIRTILWHELGHCMYGLKHPKESGKIMSAYTNYGKLRDWQTRVDELFTQIRGY